MIASSLNISPDRLSGRNDFRSSKVNFRPDIRQKFFLEKNEHIKKLCGS